MTSSLMNTLVSKQSIIEAHGASYQVALSLKGQKSLVDQVGTSVIGMVPDYADVMQTQQTTLDNRSTISVFESATDGQRMDFDPLCKK